MRKSARKRARAPAQAALSSSRRGGWRPSRRGRAPSMRTISATSSSPATRSTVAAVSPPAALLLDPEVGRRQRGDLRQVGDAEHLAALGELAQPLADRPRGVAADRRRRPRRRPACARPRRSPSPLSASMIRESSPPEAASLSGEVGIPGLVATSSSTVSAPFGPEAVGMRLERDLEPRAVHRQLGELGGDPLAERRRRLAPAALSSAASSARRACASAIRASSSAASSSAFSSRSISARQRSACSSTASIEPPCFRFSRSNASRRSSTASSRPGLGLDPVEVGAQVAGRRRRARRAAARSRSASASSSASTPATAAERRRRPRRAPRRRRRRPRRRR